VYFAELQRDLKKLLLLVGVHFPQSRREIIRELIDANECGLALEVLSEALVEQNVEIEPDLANSILRLARTMQMESTVRALLG
jgi:hypothetical protein